MSSTFGLADIPERFSQRERAKTSTIGARPLQFVALRSPKCRPVGLWETFDRSGREVSAGPRGVSDQRHRYEDRDRA
jgi:hypothetical protein